MRRFIATLFATLMLSFTAAAEVPPEPHVAIVCNGDEAILRAAEVLQERNVMPLDVIPFGEKCRAVGLVPVVAEFFDNTERVTENMTDWEGDTYAVFQRNAPDGSVFQFLVYSPDGPVKEKEVEGKDAKNSNTKAI